jgi:hypothetical protein
MEVKQCFLGKVSYSDSKGNHLKATELYPKGWRVHAENPIMIASIPLVVKRKNRETNPIVCMCPNCCGKGKEEFACFQESCAITYCSEKCRQDDVETHRRECSKTIVGSHIALPIRMLSKKIFPPVNVPMVNPGPSQLEALEKIINQMIVPLFPEFRPEVIKRVVLQMYSGILCIRTFVSKHSIAYAYYQFAYYYNHSCDPNLYYYFNNGEFNARAIRDIQPNEELTICMRDELLFTTSDIRDESTVEMFSNRCWCDRCKDNDRKEKEDKVISKRVKTLSNQTELNGLIAMRNNLHNMDSIKSILALDAIIPKIYGPCHAVRFQMYYQQTVKLFNVGVIREIQHFPDMLKDFLISSEKEKVVVGTLPYLVWARFMKFLLLSVVFNIDLHEAKNFGYDEKDSNSSQEKNNSSKSKKTKVSKVPENNKKTFNKKDRKIVQKELELTQAAFNAKCAIDEYLHMDVFAMDVLIYESIGKYIEIMKDLDYVEIGTKRTE